MSIIKNYASQLEIIKQPTLTKTLWFDMDGVLAIYERDAYIKADKDLPSKFETKNQNYFISCQPDPKMINVLLNIIKSNKIKQIFITTKLTNDADLALEHKCDKLSWLNIHLEYHLYKYKENHPNVELPTVSFIASPLDKHISAELHLGRPLSVMDILIDDYNPNLIKWSDNGGTAIKYGNNINNLMSFNGIILQPTMSEDDITQYILTLT